MNLNHRSDKLLIVGASGTGKTTYLARFLLASTDATQFIYDHQGDIGLRLGVKSIVDYDGLVAAIEDSQRVICFDPAELYAGDLHGGFRFFCQFTFEAASNFEGRKLFVSDEIQMVTDTSDLPYEFMAALETGRRQEIDLALVTQAPNQCHNYIRNQATEIVVFNVAMDTITKGFLTSRCFPVDDIPSLPEGHYIARDVRRNLEKRGQLWSKKKVEKRFDMPPVMPVDSPQLRNAPPSESTDGEVT